MSTEQIKNLEQYPDEKIHQVTNQPPHPEVWKSGIADQESKTDAKKEWEIQNKAFELEIKMDKINPENTTKLKSEFRQFYHQTQKELSQLENSDPKLQQNSYLIKAKKENLENKLKELIVLIIRTEIKSQCLKCGVKLTIEELQNIKLVDYGEMNWKMQNGKLERTVFKSWIGTDLGEIQKIEKKGKTDEEIRQNLIFEAYKRSIQMTNAYFFGVKNSKEEIDRLAENKKKAIQNEIENQQKNPTQKSSPNELYFN